MHAAYDPETEVTEEMPGYMMEAYMYLDRMMRREDFEEHLCSAQTIRCELNLDTMPCESGWE